MKILIAAAHSHTWFWTQSFITTLNRFRPKMDGVEIQVVLVDNSWPWSPTIKGIEDTALAEGITILKNPKPNKFHPSALDAAMNTFECDLFMALETDVQILRHGWLDEFVRRLGPNDYAVGAWHHEQFVNPSCTLYRASVIREMKKWCDAKPNLLAYWGDGFATATDIEIHPEQHPGPFEERRGWAPNSAMKVSPSGQRKGPGWYEPGQALHHWATEAGHTVSVMDTHTTRDDQRQIPTGTYYENGRPPNDAHMAVHLWAGTRALDLLKHSVTDPAVYNNMFWWMDREAKLWLRTVDKDVQAKTVKMVRELGWYTRAMDDREREAVTRINHGYREAGIPI